MGEEMDFSKQKTDSIQFWVLNVASFIAQLSLAMINLNLVYHLRGAFHLSADKIGLAASVGPLSYLLACICICPYITHIKPRHLVKISLIGMVGAIWVLASTHSMLIAYLSLAVYGVLQSFLWPQIEGWFSRGKEGKQLSHVSNAFNFSWSLGAGLAPLFAGMLVEHTSTLAFYVAMLLLTLVFLLIAISSTLVPGIRAMKSEKDDIRESNRVDQSTPLRFYCWTGVVILYTGMSVIVTIFPLYAQDKLAIAESLTGLLLLVRGVTTCICFLLLGKVEFWHFKKRYIFLTQGLFALSCLVITRFTSNLAYGIFFLLFGILFATAYTQSMFHGVSGSVKRSQRMIIHEVLLTVGAILGAVMGGYLYENYSFALVLISIAVATTIVIAIELMTVVLLSRRTVVV